MTQMLIPDDDVLARIERLERRVAELEARPREVRVHKKLTERQTYILEYLRDMGVPLHPESIAQGVNKGWGLTLSADNVRYVLPDLVSRKLVRKLPGNVYELVVSDA